MFKYLTATAFFLSFLASATTFTLKNNLSGATYSCSPGSGGGGVANPDCVSDLNDFCDFYTAYDSGICFTKSARACSNGASISCVKEVYSECDFETALSNEECFDQSVIACGGGSDAIKLLIRAATKNAEDKIRRKTQ